MEDSSSGVKAGSETTEPASSATRTSSTNTPSGPALYTPTRTVPSAVRTLRWVICLRMSLRVRMRTSTASHMMLRLSLSMAKNTAFSLTRRFRVPLPS